MALNLGKEIRRAVDTGKVHFGTKQGQKNSIKGKAEAIVLSSNARQAVREKILHYGKVSGIPVIEFKGTGMELGAVCGKPFTVSVLTIEKTGKSKLLSAAK